MSLPTFPWERGTCCCLGVFMGVTECVAQTNAPESVPHNTFTLFAIRNSIFLIRGAKWHLTTDHTALPACEGNIETLVFQKLKGGSRGDEDGKCAKDLVHQSSCKVSRHFTHQTCISNVVSACQCRPVCWQKKQLLHKPFVGLSGRRAKKR